MGKVYFVGAGPGAEDLITVRGLELIKKADTIVYAGSLVNPELLKYKKPGCIVYNSALMTLEEVTEVLITDAGSGKTVVRLHTGDQSVYGAVREQMDILDKAGVEYESCPGVSAAFGAAASLNLEYTLPGISQTLIITRMEGRTAVPEKESIEKLAAHEASMAIYLSTGLLEKLSDRLIAGGYPANAAAAIIYKATWPEEKAVSCTVETLADTARKNNITKTAIVLVGRVLEGRGYERSRLYASDFSTEYRRAGVPQQALQIDIAAGSEKLSYRHSCEPVEGKVRTSVISFTKRGAELSAGLLQLLSEEYLPARAYSKYSGEEALPEGVERLDDSIGIKDWAAQESSDGRALIFIGALGICVRAISGITADKLRSVPVINIDETGHFVIPVLSGHVGGANELAVKIAEAIGAVPVVTTATDLNNAFAADMFAMENGLGIVNREGIAAVSSRSLDGKPVRLQIEDFPDILSENNETSGAAEKNVEGDIPDIIISSRHELFGKGRLNLCPRKYAVGIGCRKGKGVNELREFLEDELRKAGIDIAEVGAIASIDLKKDEPGLIALSRQLKVPFITFTAEMLKKAVGEFAESAFVEKEAGVGNVCERAAMLLTGNTGLLPVRKTARDGMTLAVAENRSSGSGN